MEKILSILEEVSGHTYDTLYDLLFTTERVMVLMVHHPADETYKFGMAELLLGGRLARQRKSLDRKPSPEGKLQTYKEKTFEELLAGHRFNYEIPYSIIKSVEVNRGLFQTQLKFQTTGLSLAGRTIQFTLTKNQISLAQELLSLALPSKFKK
jgi:hypothetical protein